MKAGLGGLIVSCSLAGCASAGMHTFGATTEQHESVASGTLHVLRVDLLQSTPGAGQVLVQMRNNERVPVIVAVDVRAEPGMWLAPVRQETSLFYVPPHGERSVRAPYAFAHLSPEAVLRVRVGRAEEHSDGHVHVPEPAAVRSFDVGASSDAAAFMDRFDSRSTTHLTLHALRGMLTPPQLDSMATSRQRAIEELTRMLGVDPPPGLRIVFYPDAASKEADTRHVGNGLARGSNIVEIRNDAVRLDPYHELAHMMSGQLGWAPSWLNEGFAVWATERLGADALEFIVGPGVTVDQAVCHAEQGGALFPVTELLSLPDIGPEESRPHVSYSQAASFVGFLADRYSLEALRSAYATISPAAASDENEDAFIAAFGVSSVRAGEMWSEHVRTLCSADRS